MGPHPHEVGKRERDDVRALLRGAVARRELLLVDLHRREAAEQVPVERTVGGERHVRHELDALGGDLAHRRDELERGPGMVPHGPREGEELLARRRA